MNKKRFFIIALIILVIVISLIYFTKRTIKFAETRIFVVDQNGDPLSDAKVKLNYICSFGAIVDRADRTLKEFSGTTDKSGVARFDSYNQDYKYYVDISRCRKEISAYKKDYCGENGNYSCSDIRKRNGVNFKTIKEYININPQEYYSRDGLYYWKYEAWENKTLHPSEIEISIRLIKL